MMPRWAFFWGVFLLLMPGVLRAQPRVLMGRVLLVGPHEEKTPAEEVEVTLVERGDTVRTKAQGLFRLFLPDVFTTGEKITLSVSKEGWRIQYPLDGEVHIPAALEKEVVQLRLLPVGSKKFWTDDRIEKFIQDTAERAKQQVQVGGKPDEIDFGRYIQEWAAQYGFSAQQAKAEIDKWVADVQQRQDDFHILGLAAYAKKQFGKANALFLESAEVHAKQLEALRREEQTLTEKTVRDFRLAGDAAYNDYTFNKALAAYQRALDYVSRNTQPRLWATVVSEIGQAHAAIGIRTQGTAVHNHLHASQSAYRQALEVFTRDQLPQDWATTQNNLGNALGDQGIRTGGEEGRELLAQAVVAYRQALEVHTRDQLPQQWATTQNNLGIALTALGRHIRNVELLEEARETLQAAYAFYSDAGSTQYAEYFESKLSEINQLIEELK